MKQSQAEISREYGPFPGVDAVHGVTFDGQHVWFASGAKLNAIDPDTGQLVRSIDVSAHAGTAFDGTCFRSPRIAFTRSIRRPGVCCPRFRRPALIRARMG
jgi:hypothetical protein